MGRDFTSADNQPGAEKVAIIGHGIWQRDFAGAADILGRGVRINGAPATIVGVMPKGFAFPINEELWVPLILGLVAVVLAAVGIYGVTSFAVSRRTQEFGVRMALGADRRCILGMLLRQGSRFRLSLSPVGGPYGPRNRWS